MKTVRLLFLITLSFGAISFANAQDGNSVADSTGKKSFYETLLDLEDGLVQISDYSLSNLRASGIGSYPTKVRVLTLGENMSYKFLVLTWQGNNYNYFGYLTEAEVHQLYKVFQAFKEQMKDKSTTASDYYEHKYITKDRIEFGYSRNASYSPVWFIDIGRYSNRRILPRGEEALEKMFTEAFDKFKEISQ